MKKNIISIIVTVIVGFLYFYVALPSLNFNNMEFYSFITVLILVYWFVSTVLNFGFNKVDFKRTIKRTGIVFVVPIIFILIVIINIIGSPLFNSKKYANRIEIDQSKSFAEDVAPVDFTKLPLLDKTSSQKLGDRVMGQMSDLVSQYNVSDLYTQINYNNSIIRVTPLEYASFIKWVTNKKDGVKGYISVDSVNGEAKLTRLDKGMKYLPSAYFGKDLMRKLRFTYPTLNFGKISFEIDNDGKPFWVVPVIKYHAVGLRPEVKNVIILDAVNGKGIKYDIDNVPSWIDMAYSADLIIEQVDDWGTYQKGFLNSIFGQKSVINTTEGYNYLAMNDDIYLYTGITSIVNDESNLGFILTNMRTKETSFYNAPGAEEYSAMASAEGAVQQMKYTSTFPLLINLNNKPTYLVSLKDAAGLVKMYGFVDVADYQKVVVTDASKGIETAANNYLGDDKTKVDDNELKNKTITVRSIKEATISGNSYFYITDTQNNKYKVSISVSDKLPFVNNGDELKIGFTSELEITSIIKIY